MRKTITVYKYGLLVGAFVIGLALAFGNSQVFGQGIVVVQQPVVKTYEVTTVATPVLRSRVVVPRTMVVQAPMRVVQAPAPTYTVVETQRAPYVRRGAFGLGILPDRIINPRRTDLSIIAQ